MKIHKNKIAGGAALAVASSIIVVATVLMSFIIWMCGANNPQTPAGYVGYLTKEPFFGQTRFYGMQTGPISSGLTWRLFVQNISITPYNYDEEFDANQGTGVLSKDNLNISFAIHIIFKIKANDVKGFVERYSTLGQGTKEGDIVKMAYSNLVKEPLRTYARDEVQKLNGMDIKENFDSVGQRIEDSVLALTKDTPFQVLHVVIGNIQYPAVIASAVATKLAKTQELEQQTYVNQIEQKKAEQRVIQAQGIAKAMEVIQQKLTPLYLQHEAIEAQKLMVGSPNHTTIYVPVGNMGVPLVQTPPKD